MHTKDLEGVWIYRLGSREEGEIMFPGTLLSCGVGKPAGVSFSAEPSPAYTVNERAEFRRILNTDEFPSGWKEGHLFFETEKTGAAEAFLDGKKVPVIKEGTVLSPSLYDLTGMIEGKEAELSLVFDRSARHFPKSVSSSFAGRESLTGSTGRTRLIFEKKNFLSDFGVKNREEGLEVSVTLSLDDTYRGDLVFSSSCLKEEIRAGVACPAGRHRLVFVFPKSTLREDAPLWDIGEGKLVEMKVQGDSLEEKRALFGIRTLSSDSEGRLTMNGKRVFLKGETNCAFFPKTGYEPADRKFWKKIMDRYRACGINFVRFASHCPPEAAFEAADRAGILVMTELSRRDDAAAFSKEEERAYTQKELEGVLEMLASHPSFAMLTLGTGLGLGDTERKWARALLQRARKEDASRLYAITSAPDAGHGIPDAGDDFFMSTAFGEGMLRGCGGAMTGCINRSAPSMTASYDETISDIRKSFGGPVLSMDVGSYEILPDLSSVGKMEESSGDVYIYGNLPLIETMARAAGLLNIWEENRRAGAALGLVLREAEVELALRTKGLSGMCFLGFQDAPWYGNAFFGLFDVYGVPKEDFVVPDRIRRVLADARPLVLADRYCYEAGQTVSIRALFANYTGKDMEGSWEIRVIDHNGRVKRRFPDSGRAHIPAGSVSMPGDALVPLDEEEGKNGEELSIELSLGGCSASRRIWVYPVLQAVHYGWIEKRETGDAAAKEGAVIAEIPDEGESSGGLKKSGKTPGKEGTPGEKTGKEEEKKEKEDDKLPSRVLVTGDTKEAFKALLEGAAVLLMPPATPVHFPGSALMQFSTWYGPFGTGELDEYMGIRTDPQSPIYRFFPTKEYADWQWWPVTNRARAMVLPKDTPGEISLITVVDGISGMRKESALIEVRAGRGKLLVSSLGLMEKQNEPGVRALLWGIIRYLGSCDCSPKVLVDREWIEKIVR